MLKLFGANVCPFVHRVRLTLAEKDLEYEYVAIDLRNKPDWYHKVLPSGKVPYLESGALRLWESNVICDYLEEAYPEPSLYPSDPALRAVGRLWRERLGSGLIANFYGLLKAQNSADQERYREALIGNFEELESEAFQDKQGGGLLGSRLSLVDLALYPWFERWTVLEHYRDFPVPKRFEKLNSWRRSMAGRPSVAEMVESSDFYIEQYAHYARGN